MDSNLRQYLSEIGRRGGQKSRRWLSPEEARRMVSVREARKAYARFHARCFWSAPRDLRITIDDLPWIAQKLREQGGREGWEAAEKLCR